MVKTYKGYFTEDGRFIPDGAKVKLPVRRRAVVNVFDEAVIDNEVTQDGDKIYLQDRIEKIALILASALAAEDDVMTDDDWDEMLTLRSQTNAGLSRAVTI